MVWVLLAAFLVAALITAYLTFIFVRQVVASRASSSPGTVNIDSEAAFTPQPVGTLDLNTPLQKSEGPTPKPWDGTSRVTILLMGLDYRDWEQDYGPSRTDTMMLLSVDPVSRTAGILSIPRDLWVSIPGYDYAKINNAYFLGEAYQEPGGGPGLAIQTVEDFLGLPINYYAQVDFFAFEQFITEIGGLEVEVPEEITVDPLGPGNTVVLQPGRQKLDGPVALAYARNRDTLGGDFDRASRQQQVILAIRDRILSLDMLPILITKSPILYQQLSDGVHTNMTLEQIISLAWLAQQIPAENIRRGVIGPDEVIFTFSWDGQDILQPVPEEILRLRDEIFTTEGPISPVATEVIGDPRELMEAENASLSVLNGTYTPGLAASTSQFLESQGYTVSVTGNAQEVYDFTTIIDYSGSPYTVQSLVELMDIQPSQIFQRYEANSTVDITILLGNDWATSHPVP